MTLFGNEMWMFIRTSQFFDEQYNDLYIDAAPARGYLYRYFDASDPNHTRKTSAMTYLTHLFTP